jgi:hypothetical protein
MGVYFFRFGGFAAKTKEKGRHFLAAAACPELVERVKSPGCGANNHATA